MVSNPLRILMNSVLVFTAFALGVWIPLDILYFKNHVSMNIAVDAWVLFVIASQFVLESRGQKFSSYFMSGGKMKVFSRCVDIITSLPVYTLEFLVFGPSNNFFLFTNVLLIRRLFRVRDLLDEFDSMHPVAYRLLPLFVYMPILVHIIACCWIALGSGTIGPDADHVLEYVRAVYWAFTTLTTVGYGDIAAKTIPQMLFASTTQVLGVGVFGFVLSNVASMLARLDAARENHMSMLDRVETFMRYNELPHELRKRVRAFYKYMWQTHRGYNDDSILASMPPGLRTDLSVAVNWDIINRVPLLKTADEDCMRDIARHLQAVMILPGEKIFSVDEPGDAMYFIHSGNVEILGPNDELVAKLKPGQFFGEMALVDRRPRRASAVSRSYGELYVLDQKAFEGVLTRHPHFQESIQQTIRARRGAS